jgi:hypothetical protein
VTPLDLNDEAARTAPIVPRSAPERRNVIGPRVREARYARRPRMTQMDLAALLVAYGAPISVTGLSKIEAGTRAVYDFEVRALSEALVVPAAWLLQVEEL